MSICGPLEPPLGLRKPWEPLEAFGSFGSSVRPRGLVPLSSPCPPHSMSICGLLEPSLGLRKPWEPLEAFSSFGSSVRLRDLVPLVPLTHCLLLPSPPEPPWVPGTSLRLQEALRAFESIWQPWVFSQTRGLVPLASLTPSLPLAPHSLSLPGSLGPPLGLRKPWEPLEAFSSLGSSVRLRGLVPLVPCWWLIRVNLVVDWLFLLQNLGPCLAPTKVFCCSVNVQQVVVLFAGGGDT